MTAYVDNYRRHDTIDRVCARWSHLTASTPAELHAFARAIGLRTAWYRPYCQYREECPRIDGVCAHYHYEVTDTKRIMAMAYGAREVDTQDFADIVSWRKHRFRTDQMAT